MTTEQKQTTPKFSVRGSQPLRGEVRVPGDKSISHRSLMLGALATGTTNIRGLLEGEDCLRTAQAMQQLGVQIEVSEHDGERVWHVAGVGSGGLQSSNTVLDLGNSGTGMRLLAGLLAGQGVNATLVGDESLMSRPMERIAAPLRSMGADVQTTDGKPPMHITHSDCLRGRDYVSPVASAQIKSAVLLAGLGAKGVTRVIEPLQSRDHTERLLPAFGCPVTKDDSGVWLEGPSDLQGIEVTVPGDISSAAFLLVAASVIEGSDVTLINVGINPTRDGVLLILEAMGADIERLNEREVHGEPVCDLRVQAASLRGIDVPAEWVPKSIDEFPVLFVAAALAEGVTTVRGAEELKVKESDRLGAMARGLRTLGVDVTETADGLVIVGRGRSGSKSEPNLHGGHIESFDDHRIAMAFAVAGGRASEPVIINDVANVATSFPGFAELMQSLGLNLEQQ